MERELETSSLATQHSLLLEERLRGAVQGPTSFSGLFGGATNRVNEYASFLGPDEDSDPGERARPLQRWVSNIGRLVPAGVQIEPRKLEIEMPPPVRRAAGAAAPAPQQRVPQQQQQQCRQQQAEQPAAKHPRLSGRFASEGAPAEQQQAAAQPPLAPQPAAQPIAHAAPVPGNPLKIRLKFARGSSVPRGSPDKPLSAEAAAALVQSARQLGAGLQPPLSPIPAGWAEVVACASPPQSSPAGAAAPAAVALGGSGRSGAPSPFESVSAEEFGQIASGGRPPSSGAAAAAAPAEAPAGSLGPAAEPARQLAQQAGPHEEAQQRRQPSPPAAAAGVKRPAAAPAPIGAAPEAPGPAPKRQKPSAAAAVAEAASPGIVDTPTALPDGSAMLSAAATDGSHPFVQAQSTNAGTMPAAAAQQQPPAPAFKRERRERSSTPAAEQQPPAPAFKRERRERSSTPAAEQQPQQPQQQAVPPWAAEALAGRSDESRLGVVAALLPPTLQQAAGGELPGSRMVQSLQEEGKKLKKFAEKKMRDGQPTHVSSMFLCQSCVKFLTVAAVMEGHPAKYSQESTSSMYSQTASLLDSCAHNAGRAEGPAMITTAISLLAQRLAAVARLRAAYCLRTEGMQQVATFRAALEKASGETYQRPSPTDSNTSTSISVPLDAAGNAATAKPAAAAVGGAARSGTPPGGRGRAGAPVPPAAGGKAPPPAAAAEALVGMPKAVLERQLLAAQHSQAVVTALSAFSKSSERLREFMGQAAAQSNVQGLKVAAAALLLSADAGMGPAAAVLAFAKDALDAVMQMQ
ncbi:hypothetical protein ABPG75_001598 [Micractinium tetrahymenae]